MNSDVKRKVIEGLLWAALALVVNIVIMFAVVAWKIVLEVLI